MLIRSHNFYSLLYLLRYVKTSAPADGGVPAVSFENPMYDSAQPQGRNEPASAAVGAGAFDPAYADAPSPAAGTGGYMDVGGADSKGGAGGYMDVGGADNTGGTAGYMDVNANANAVDGFDNSSDEEV